MLVHYLVSVLRPYRPRTLLVASIPAVAALFLAACGNEAPKAATTPTVGVRAPAVPLEPGEGMLPVRGGRIWHKMSGTGKGTPMVLLHGGPGTGSYYLKPFEEIGNDRPVVRYDQLGAGKSDRLTDTSLMNIPRFVEERVRPPEPETR